MRAQRDAYANLNKQALHYAARGVTINEIHNVYEVPKSLRDQWAARSYHGDVQNNARAVINRFLGHYDGNPANLIPLSPKDSAPLYVDMMGGPAKIISKNEELLGQGKYPIVHRSRVGTHKSDSFGAEFVIHGLGQEAFDESRLLLA
ncbi:alkyl sulfatase dimerization domain-containing protein, partial [Nitrobacter vulgaris]|uniref:alkyl sulfatase dimerization domain-containing protein n=1 Tax=Nitrobacter vulgaris TaxID=29421 RepID=UPI002377E17A